MDEIVEVLEFEKEPVQLATLEALTSACSDKTCRALVVGKCSQLLLRLSKNKSGRLKSACLSTLIKTMSQNKELENTILADSDNIVDTFAELIADPKTESFARSSAVESLAYISVHGRVKRKVCDPKFLKALFSLAAVKEERALQYGIVSIIANLTAYKRKMTEEEEQVEKIRVMAKEQAPTPATDPEDLEGPVEKRGGVLKHAGVFPLLVSLAKSSSTNVKGIEPFSHSIDVVSQTFLNLVTNKENRGLAIQQGAVPSLISLFSSCSTQFSSLAGQALAKLTITTDPNIAFKGETASELVRPFVTLCNGDNPLQQFEALMALTNLASMGSPIRQVIISAKGIKAMEMLQFSENSMIQRAATEALCNMIYEVLIRLSNLYSLMCS